MSGIDKDIVRAEDVYLSDEDILRITNHKCKVLLYSDLEQYDDIDSMLAPHGAAVVLYQLEQSVGHWVTIIKHGSKHIEVFDPYALKIDQELQFSQYNLRRHNGMKVPHLSHLLDSSPYIVTYNDVQLQQFKHHVNTCGRWCALRVRFRSDSLDRFIGLFTKNEHYGGDFWVSALTILA
jgi:hypothetical protein